MPPNGKFHGRKLRTGRYSQARRAYLVTTVLRHRRPLFKEFEMACVAARSLAHVGTLGDNRTLAHVIMPDHVHWLLQLGTDYSLVTAVAMMKNLCARRIGGRIWQQGFHDHAIRDGEDIHTVARYIVANPLRAGLVDNIGDYPFWDAVWLGRNNTGVW